MGALEAHGPSLHPRAIVAAVTREAGGTLALSFEGAGEERATAVGGFDVVLAAVGRAPATAALGLGRVGVEVDKQGRVKVDAFQNTSVKGVYAVGDAATGGLELTPVAIAAGRRLADRLFGGEPAARLEYSDVATVVFR